MSDALANLAAMTTPTVVIPAAEADPPAGKTQSWNCAGLLGVGQWYAQILAVDTAGNKSPRGGAVPFISADDVSPQAPSNLLVGP